MDGEAMKDHFTDATKGSAPVSETVETQSGLRTERVTPPAPVSRPAETRQTQRTKAKKIGVWQWFPASDKPAPPPPPAPPRVNRGSGVFDANGDEVPWEGVVASLTDERDKAIRERDRIRENAKAEHNIAEAALDERDAAIRERDTAKEETTLLLQAIGLATTAVPSMEINVDDPVGMMRRVVARVAELESDVADCNIIPGDRWREAVSAVTGTAAPAASGNVEKKPMQMPSREWFERMASVDDSEMSVGGLAGRVTELESSAPPASVAAGTEPVAWICEWSDHTALYDSLAIAEVDADGDIVPQPLYRSPPQAASGWLTAEERGSIQHAANLAKASWSYSVAQELENILARSSPPEVVLPMECDGPSYDSFVAGWNGYRDEALKALAAAGVTVKEVG